MADLGGQSTITDQNDGSVVGGDKVSPQKNTATQQKVKKLLLPYEKNKNLTFALRFFTEIQNLTPGSKVRFDFTIENEIFQDKELIYELNQRSNTNTDESILYPSDLVQMILNTIEIVKELNSNQIPQTLNNFSLLFASKLSDNDVDEISFYNQYRKILSELISEVLKILESKKSPVAVQGEEIERLEIGQTSASNYFTSIENTVLPLLEVISAIDTSTQEKNGDFAIIFNDKKYNFLQVKIELNTLLTRINRDFTDLGPSNSTFFAIRKKLRSSKFVEKYLDDIQALQLSGSNLSNQLKFVDTILSKKEGEETLYKILFRSYRNDHQVFDTLDPSAYLNPKDKEIAAALTKICTAITKLHGYNAENDDELEDEDEKDDLAEENDESKTETKDTLSLQELLRTAFTEIYKRIFPQILDKEVKPALVAWQNLPENEELDTSGFFELIEKSFSEDQKLSEQVNTVFLQCAAVNEAEQVDRTKKGTDFVSFYDSELEKFIITSDSEKSDELKKAYENWLNAIFEQIYSQTSQIFLEKLKISLEETRNKQLSDLQDSEKKLEQEQKADQDLASSGIPANIAELVETASGVKVTDASSATSALIQLRSRDPKAYKALQDQLFVTSKLHRDLHLRMQSALLAQLNAQGFAFTSVDQIPLEIRTALFADLQNYLYSLSPEEITRALTDGTTRSLLLADFNRKLLLGQLPLANKLKQFISDNYPQNTSATSEISDPLTIVFRDYLDTPQNEITAKLYDTKIIAGYSPESGQSFADYLNIRFKRALSQEELNWVNEVLLYYAQQFALQQEYATRNLGNTGFLPFDDLGTKSTEADSTANLDLLEDKDYLQLRNLYLAQIAQQEKEQLSQLSQPSYTTQFSDTSRENAQYQGRPSRDIGAVATPELYIPAGEEITQTADRESPEEKAKRDKSAADRLAQSTLQRAAIIAFQNLVAFIKQLLLWIARAIPFILGSIAKAAAFLWGVISPVIAPLLSAAGVAIVTAGAAAVATAVAAGAAYLAAKGIELLIGLGKSIFEFGATALSNIFNGISSLFSGSAPAASYAVVTSVAAVGVTTIIMQNTASDGMYLLTQESLDVETSKYLEIDKIATPTRLENNTPTEITYTITIKAKDEYVVTPKLDTVTDTFSNIGKVTGLPDEVAHNQAVKDALRAKIAETQNKITNSGVTIEYSLPALSGEDVFVVNTFKLDFSVVDTQAEGSPTIEDSWKDSASIRIGDPTFSDCFVFVDSNTPETEKIAAAKARIGTREGGIASIVDWPDEEITTLLAAFSTRVTENTGFMSSLKCDESSEFGPILLFRLKANGILYGGWSIDENAIGFFDETFNYSLTSTEYTVIHELGHTIDKRNAQFRTRFDSIGGGCPPTYNIATCTPTEPFAEAIALFVIYPDYTFNLGGPTRTTYDFPGQRRQQYCKIKEIVFGDKDIEDGRPTISCN